MRLTMKMPASKLREATSADSISNVAENSRESFQGGEVLSGPRSSRAKRNYVVESDSEDDDDEEEEEIQVSDDGEESEEGGEEEEDDDQQQEIEEDGEEAEDESEDPDADADGDIEMDEEADDGIPIGAPPPPIIKVKGPVSKPTISVTPAKDTKIQSVEAKEMEIEEDDDEELSELDSADAEDEGGEEDAEGEDVDDIDEGDGSRSPDAGSPGSTPDVSKMTKRQRGRLDQVMGSDFLQLPMGKNRSPFTCSLEEKKADLLRTSNEKTFHSRRTCHAPRRNGQTTEEFERETQRGRKGTSSIPFEPLSHNPYSS